jgi:hypothetical protein
MDEFGWCPLVHCGQLAEVDRIKNFGICSQCGFQFCLTCKEKYHFSKQCPALRVDKEEAERILMEKLDRMKELFKN